MKSIINYNDFNLVIGSNAFCQDALEAVAKFVNDAVVKECESLDDSVFEEDIINCIPRITENAWRVEAEKCGLHNGEKILIINPHMQ